MKNIILLLMAIVLCACHKEPPTTPSQKGESAQLKIILLSTDMESASRALTEPDESAVQDVNIYMFHKTTALAKHVYASRTSSVVMNLIRGDYDLYVVANYGSDMGEKSHQEIADYQITISAESELVRNSALVMSGYRTVSVAGVMTLPITLKRAVAKINLSVAVAPALADRITLQSVRLADAPCRATLFSTNRPISTSDVIEYEKRDCRSGYAGSFYMLESANGMVNSITDQRDKNRENAPTFTPYIHIEGYTPDGKVDYFIYLGENNTSDFNTFANRQYNIEVVVLGDNSVDCRVSFTTLSLTDFQGAYAPNQTATSTIELSCSNNSDNIFSLSYSIIDGSGKVTIDGIDRACDTPFVFMSGESYASAEITYTQSVPGHVKLLFVVTDKYGYRIERTLSTEYAARNPIVASVPPVDNATAHSPAPITLSISELDYNSSFKVKYEIIKGTGILSRDGITLVSGSETTVDGGSHALSFATTDIGAKQIRFTITDSYGQQRVENVSFDVAPLRVLIALGFRVDETIKTIVSGSYLGTQSDPLILNVTAQSPLTITTDVTFNVAVSYNLGYYATTSSKSVTPTTKTLSFTLRNGNSYTSAMVASYVGYCMGSAPPPTSARKLLRTGYYLEKEFARPPAVGKYLVTVTPKSISPLSSHSGSIVYSVTVTP